MVIGEDEKKISEAFDDFLGSENGKQFNQALILGGLTQGLKSLAPLMKELDFVVEIEVEGDYLKEGFEPKVKVKIKIGRDMRNILELQKSEREQANNKGYMDTIERVLRDVGEDLTTKFGITNTSTTGTGVSADQPTGTQYNNFTWTDTDKPKE